MLSNEIDLTKPVAKTLEEHPELKEILVDLGFKPLNNPVLLKTLGQTTSLLMGARLIKLPLSQLRQTLVCHGYEVIGGGEEA